VFVERGLTGTCGARTPEKLQAEQFVIIAKCQTEEDEIGGEGSRHGKEFWYAGLKERTRGGPRRYWDVCPKSHGGVSKSYMY
jgi:hypothetical protein